jgi:hypothetical protein
VTPPLHPITPQVFESPRSLNSSFGGGGGGGGGGGSKSGRASANETSSGRTSSRKRGPVIPRNDFGISHMMAIIEYKASQAKSGESDAGERKGEVDVVDERLFGRPVDLEQLHPQAREIFEGGFKMLEEMDKVSIGFFCLLRTIYSCGLLCCLGFG